MEPAVRREVVLPATPDEAWELISEPEHLEEWFAEHVRIDLRPGGEVVFARDDGKVRRGVVEEVEAPRRLAFRWSDTGNEGAELPAETRVEFEIFADPDGSRLRVVEAPTHLATTEPLAAMLSRELGWDVLLGRLAQRRTVRV